MRHSRASATASVLRPSSGVTLPGLANTALGAAVLVVLAVAVIIGILAMHSFASPASHSETGMSATSSTSTAASHHETTGAFAASSPDCVGCGEDASMAVMWCVLALLTMTLLLVAPKLVKEWAAVALRKPSIARAILKSFGPIARPLSLTVLCISRT